MRFSGRLQLEADPRNWLRTDLLLSPSRLELTAGSEVLGSWSTSQVKATRVDGDRFELQLGDDRAVFAADDALSFSYEAMPVLTKRSMLSAASGLRSKLRKGLASLERPDDVEGETETAGAPAVAVAAPENDTAERPLGPTARKLRELMAAARGAQTGELPEESLAQEDVGFLATASYASNNGSNRLPVLDAGVEDSPGVESGSEELPWAGALEFLSSVPIREEGPEPSSQPADVVPAPFIRGWEEVGVVVTARPQLLVALEKLIEEARTGSMSVSQIEAVTSLITAVGEIVENRPAS
jgi:hypothetical protein